MQILGIFLFLFFFLESFLFIILLTIRTGGCFIHQHIQSILDLVLSPSIEIRNAVFHVIKSSSKQSLLHPITYISSLISMSCDPNQSIQQGALKLLIQIDDKDSTFIPNRLLDGIKHSYKYLQQSLGISSPPGFKLGQEKSCEAILTPIYSILKKKQKTKDKRNEFLRQIINLFDFSEKTHQVHFLFNLKIYSKTKKNKKKKNQIEN